MYQQGLRSSENSHSCHVSPTQKFNGQSIICWISGEIILHDNLHLDRSSSGFPVACEQATVGDMMKENREPGENCAERGAGQGGNGGKKGVA